MADGPPARPGGSTSTSGLVRTLLRAAAPWPAGQVCWRRTGIAAGATPRWKRAQC